MTTCPCCHQVKAQLYCSRCLREGIATNHKITRAVSNQCVDASIRAKRLLEGDRSVQKWRRLRAEVAKAEQRVLKLQLELATRRQALRSSRPSPPDHPEHRPVPLSSIPHRLIHARQVLVREAISVFGVQHDGVWSIAGFPLPPPDQFKSYPSASINAALVHTVHLVTLITEYLSVELPYVPVDRTVSPNVPHINSSTFRQATLWFSKKGDKYDAFLTAFALLSHSVSYLAYTQGVNGIPPTNPLELLVAMAESPTLGFRSHAPGTDQLRSLAFSLDVKHVVASVMREAPDESEWDIVKIDEGNTRDKG